MKISENRLVSLCISGIISFILAIQITLLIDFLQLSDSKLIVRLVHGLVWLVCVGVFYILQKKIYQSKKNRLVKYFFFAIMIAIFAVIVTLFLVSKVITIPMIFQYMQSYFVQQNGLAIYTIANSFVLLLLIVFIVAFALMIKSKVNYIQYISDSVKKMEDDGFGTVMEIKNEDELSELCISINNMSLALHEKQEIEKKQEESKNKIIADISHDLRTPLTSVVGYLNLLKEDRFENREKCIQYVDVIDRRVEHMTAMINQLFEYTKLNQSDVPLHLKKVDLSVIMSYIDYEYQYLLKKSSKRWKIHYPDHPVYVNVDEEKIIRALGNLLDNAMKYSPPNSAVCIKATCKSDTVVIEISNETELIQEEDLKNIFERFYRTDQSRTEHEKNGTGLGLPIVKRIVELHNGSIDVKLIDKMISFLIELAC